MAQRNISIDLSNLQSQLAFWVCLHMAVCLIDKITFFNFYKFFSSFVGIIIIGKWRTILIMGASPQLYNSYVSFNDLIICVNPDLSFNQA